MTRLLRKHRDVSALPRPGDHAGFAAFYRGYEGVVAAYIRRRVSDSELAADLTMEVFAAALLAINRETSAPRDVVGWLFGIAHHKLVDAYRAGTAEDGARRQLGCEPVALNDADIERIDMLTDEEHVMHLLEELPVEQRDAVRARVLEDRDYPEIAKAVGTSAMVVRKRVSRGLRSLRSEVRNSR